MPTITFIEHDGTQHTVAAENGETVMEAALRGGVTGIVAECGGGCACAPCHVYVGPDWLGRLDAPALEEQDQLDAVYGCRDNSRLSCQLRVTEALDGLVVRTPSYQGR